jgi:MOSC domain-containing protein YiiM
MVNSTKSAKDSTIYPMKIISLNVGLPSAQRYEGRKVITGGTKKPVPRALLRFENFDGDRQADRVNHGGLRRRCASTHSTTTRTGTDSWDATLSPAPSARTSPSWEL